MKKVVILGGGFAGLTAAAYLANSGFKVEIIESSGKPGGRAYSFLDKPTNTILDNGQHILMGCYTDTLKFLKLVRAGENFLPQKKLLVNFVKYNSSAAEIFPLNAQYLFYPFNLLYGLLTYKAITFKERLLLLKFFLKIHLYSSKELDNISVDEWLDKEKQTTGIKKAFWEILAVGALNSNIKKASAGAFSFILKKIFFRGNKASVIILPGKGLSESYCADALKFIEEKAGIINYNETVKGFETTGDNISAIQTSLRKITDFDYIISAVPPYALERVLADNSKIVLPEFEYSSILTVHFWLKENLPGKNFYGLINSTVHWIFNHGTHITLVISDAGNLMDKDKEEIFEITSCELQKYLNIKKEVIEGYKVIKEKRATFVPTGEIKLKRPGVRTVYNNFVLAGDWINTGLPSTIESAVKSGRMAAEEVQSEN